MKFLFIVFASLAFPLGAEASPVSEARSELKILAELCPKLPAAGGSWPELKKAAAEAEKLCRETHQMFSQSLAKALAKVKETQQWMARKQMVNETEDHIYISFNLSDDPSYPMIDADNIVNEALDASLRNIYAVEGAIKEIRERRSCREKDIKKFIAVWDEPGNKNGIDRAHARISQAISNYLFGALRAFESGANDDAIKALERETGAKVTPVK